MRTDRIDPSRIEVVDAETARILRGKTGAERLAMANAMFVSARNMLLSHLAAEHPDWSEEQVTREAARRISHGFV
jgi:hypothetical protein